MSQQSTTEPASAEDGPERVSARTAGDLARRAAQGEPAAWEALVRSYVELVWGVARGHRLGPDDAADAVQLTWLRLVEQLDRLKRPERVGVWLAATARQESLRLLRRSRREPGVPDLEDLALAVTRQVEGLEDEADGSVLGRVAEALATLPPRSQAMMRLLLLEPAPSYTEIASGLDMPIGSIGPTRGRCLAAVRAHATRAPGYGVRPAGDR